MLKNNLGYPRVGAHRELKKASEQYWAGKITRNELFAVARQLRLQNWQTQVDAGIDLIPCNDFSFYDLVLDTSLMLGNIPERYTPVLTQNKANTEIDLYFAMARGYQKDGLDVTAMEMTKWFDTNYHYIVPEFVQNQQFRLFSEKVFDEFLLAKQHTGTTPKPVLIGPVTYLLLGKEKQAGFDKIDLIKKLVPVYIEVLKRLQSYGAEWVQIDEPFLALDLTGKEKAAFAYAYMEISKHCPGIKVLLTSYFESLHENTELAVTLPVSALHVDLVRAPDQLYKVLTILPANLSLSLGVVDGRNIWKNDYVRSLTHIKKAIAVLGTDRVMIAPSCSLLHTPFDLELETAILPEIKNWMAFAKQKLSEINELAQIIDGDNELLQENLRAITSRSLSKLIHKQEIKQRVAAITDADAQRESGFTSRQKIQQQRFKLPLYPTTTIGSFPQTDDIRSLRARLKKGELTEAQYDAEIEKATIDAIRWQEEIGLDVLVHGEFERNDMVEYFGERLDGFLFTKNGWVQSYGSRCVKPPVIYGDVSRPADMTVRWSSFAQQNTNKLMKGMLTGPVTILQWSFVRDDQPRSETTNQIALAIRDEVVALEAAGINVIQIDEPAIREGLPLRKKDWQSYLNWAVKAFRISASGVRDETQIHTHMCYSEFNDIIGNIADMDADVITIETSRSQMELLAAFSDFKYPNEIGPGVYDIHSPRVPTVDEMVSLLEKASELLPAGNLWVNPDCGLKTRKWPETQIALINMVQAAKQLRQLVVETTVS
ncbi:5-methyltetrahydropteroyltriglutamate--homocysteine S-methyltransferase [Mucilaginibacter sp. FT3.2]|uniref:5-methyltetrahydropteroyltriglutamate-- homocysteine S-methyltransferase n=1 Tax=Mucilaginibacter sp. FT3.2 TaxID=2723090 RepID=UPI00161CF8AB|nr:5-methyltetrahydropteroyltriglutamate--homocysteine S-methyltransferase [Mucilaginibacter sp. FT3.2]MBB6229901.1 5-methyltetrahydropteroyltriglutamate--homocysteine methyltransferase [Mucilaginibacter sp. FT3.2]